MQKITAVLIAGALFAGLIIWFVAGKPGYPAVNVINEGGPSDMDTEDFEPVSLGALMAKEYRGSDLILERVLDDNSSYTRHYITYKSGDFKISGIMNIPKGTAPEGGWPVLVLNHGYIDVSVYTNGRGLRREQDYLARNGFAVLHPDYRNHAESDDDPDTEINIRTGYVEDVINAVLAVRNSDISSLNRSRIGLLGHSMGGGIVQSVMVVKPDIADAYVLYAPVSSNVADSYNRWLSKRPETAKKIQELYGAPDANPEFWKDLSPRTYFDRVASPVLIFHGTADDSCDIEWSRETRDLLQAEGKTVELVEYAGQPHEFTSAHSDFMFRTAEFFANNI